MPIGATAAEKIDVRVIACANRDLQGEVRPGRFRADLYYRLSVFPLSTKPLAERRGDIAALAAAMVLRHAGNRAIAALDHGRRARGAAAIMTGRAMSASSRMSSSARCCCAAATRSRPSI